LKQAKVAEAKAYRTITEEAFEEKFDSAAGLQAKTWIFTMIPLLALCLAVLFGFRRYFFEHLVFATHFFAFALIWMIVTGLVASWIQLLAGVRLSSQGLMTSSALQPCLALQSISFPLCGELMVAESSRRCCVH
jgi:ethanolamine transporter EutH